MASIIKDYWNRIKIEWVEWQNYRQSVFNVRRDKKQISRSIRRAKNMNSMNGRTYYILRSRDGNINEISAYQLLKLKRAKQAYFPKYRDINHLLSECFAVVTSNDIKRKTYLEVMENVNKNETENLENELKK